MFAQNILYTLYINSVTDLSTLPHQEIQSFDPATGLAQFKGPNGRSIIICVWSGGFLRAVEEQAQRQQ